MSDSKRIILARRARFLATTLAGLGACAPATSPRSSEVSARDAGTDSAAVAKAAPAASADPSTIDSDGDGIVDALDACPLEPGRVFPQPNLNGCAPCLSIAVPTTIEIRTTIPFPSLVATPSPAVAPLLDEIAAALRERPELVVEVRGHTDDTELDEVAFARANLVTSSLASRGISRDRLIVTGVGKKEPRAANTTPKGRAENRRVDFKVRP